MDNNPERRVEVTPSVSQIRAQIEAVLDRDPDASVVAIRADRASDWPGDLSVGQRRFRMRWCESPLAVRLALRERNDDGASGSVILTPLSDGTLGADVLARLSRGRVFQMQHWGIVRGAFHARDIDARLGQHGWLADLLIEHMPTDGYPPIPSGVLDADTAWRWVLKLTCQLDSARPDVETLLKWSAAPDTEGNLAKLSEKARAGVFELLENSTGLAGHLILGAIASRHGPDALPLGLVADVLLSQLPPPSDLAAAAVRVERFTANRRLDAVGGKRWADAAVRTVQGLSPSEAQAILGRADHLLAELHLESYAGLSGVLPSGLEARLAAFGASLEAFVAVSNALNLTALESASTRVRAHHLAAASEARAERVEMAVRLARWLLSPSPASVGFDDAVFDYAANGAHVDRATLKLFGGDQNASLSRAFGRLSALVQRRRESMNQAFAATLKVWNETGSTTSSVVPIERVLDDVVASIAQHAPVLLLVVDGLSLPVFFELERDLARLGWSTLAPESSKWLGVAIAALPTVTEVSRATLLCGRLTTGAQSTEKSGFATHSALALRARPSTPVLFHKGELDDGLGLSERVRTTLSSRETRIVGVVYNAIDDQLDGATQIHLRWSLDDLRLIPALLHEARSAGRVVVLTADHGHVMEHETEQRPGTGADRWREPDGILGEGEIRIDGGRVLTPTGAKSVTVPWTDRIRYSSKKNGYHGGVSLQEVAIPIRVLAPSGMTIPSWVPAMPAVPEWWTGALTPAVAPTVPSPTSAPVSRRKPSTPVGDLFTDLPPQQPATWIDALFESPTYKTQKALAARVAPDDAEVRRLLQVLSDRGGKLSRVAIAQRLDLPILRISGFLGAVRRVLNVDQAAVLFVDEASGTVELNEGLLVVQFQLAPR